MDGSEPITLGETIRQRRLALGLSVRDAATRAGVNRETWTSAERDQRRLSTHLHHGIEQALQWEPGSIAAILDGGQPTPASDPEDLADDGEPYEIDGSLAEEVERIRRLKISPRAKIRIIKSLVALYEEDQGSDQAGQR